MKPVSDTSKREYQIDALDGFRGLAVFAVFLSHASDTSLFPPIDFAGIGKCGVYLFFLLSSFLLTYPFLVKKKAAFTSPFLLNYSVRRVLRIYPLYIIFLVVSLATSSIAHRLLSLDEPIGLPLTLNFEEFVAHLTLQQGKSITWSIVVEFKYYFLLPFIGFLFAVVLKNRLMWCLIATVALIAVVEVFFPQSEALLNDIRLGPYLPIFFIGAFLAVCQYNWNRNKETLDRRFKILLQVAGVLAAITIVLMIPSIYSLVRGEEIPFDYFHNRFIEFGILWGIMLFAVVNGAGVFLKLFESRPLRFLGHISFSVYLLHSSIVSVCRGIAGGYKEFFVYGWIVLLLVVLVSYCSYLIIERPFSKIRIGQRAVS